MADLSMEDALRLAGSLVTIGHPYQQAAINATAWDLIQMCKGASVAGRPYSPLAQAEALIEAVRNWPEGWPERGGTRKMKDEFQAMFKPREPDWKPASTADLVNAGLLTPRCEYCDPDAEYCEYGGPRRHAREKAIQDEYNRAWSERQRATAAEERRKLLPQVEPLSYEQMKAALDDEKRRRKEQLAKLDQEEKERGNEPT